jgi:hypothetical protein
LVEGLCEKIPISAGGTYSWQLLTCGTRECAFETLPQSRVKVCSFRASSDTFAASFHKIIGEFALEALLL